MGASPPRRSRCAPSWVDGAQRGRVALRIHSCGKAGVWGVQLPPWQREGAFCGCSRGGQPPYPTPPIKAAEPRVLLWPPAATPASHSMTGAFTVGPAGRRGPHCANCPHPGFQLPPWPSCGAGRVPRGAVPRPPVSRSQSHLFFFSLFFFFLRKQKYNQGKKKSLCGPSTITPLTPEGAGCSESSCEDFSSLLTFLRCFNIKN